MNIFLKSAKKSTSLKDFLRHGYKVVEIPKEHINNRSKIRDFIIRDLKRFIDTYPVESTDSATLERISDIYEDQFRKVNPRVYKYGDIYDEIKDILLL